jgi:CDP-6-deoxy-D-xylo-4-hexulose-3-dehydrase
MVSLRAHGWTRGLPWPNRLVEKDPRGEFYDLFRFVLPGYNLRPLELSGAIGVEQLRKLPGLVAARRENAKVFTSLFSNAPNLRCQREVGESSWFGFSLVLDGAARGRRDELVQRLSAVGIESRPIVAGNFYQNPVMKYLPHVQDPHLPVADDISANGLYVGNHHYDISDALRVLRDIVGEIIGG